MTSELNGNLSSAAGPTSNLKLTRLGVRCTVNTGQPRGTGLGRRGTRKGGSRLFEGLSGVDGPENRMRSRSGRGFDSHQFHGAGPRFTASPRGHDLSANASRAPAGPATQLDTLVFKRENGCMTYETREAWLNAAVSRLNRWLASDTELEPSDSVLVSFGWPRRDRGGLVIGQCYPRKAGLDQAHHVFISPLVSDECLILSTALHELIHAADDCQSKHAKAFRRSWKALGFVGKPTESTPSDDLRERLLNLSEDLGELPHTALVPAQNTKKQTTRMHKLTCPECGAVARMAQAWIDTGVPSHCDTEMEVS